MKQIVCVPSACPGGLESLVSDHFGHSDCFSLVEVEDRRLVRAEGIAGYDHGQGGCLGTVGYLRSHGVDVVLVRGLGRRPLAGLLEQGIQVFHAGDAVHVEEAVRAYVQGRLPAFLVDQACTGHSCH